MPLYTRSDVIDAIINNLSQFEIDTVISYIDELATVENESFTDSTSEIIAVDATNTEYVRLVNDLDSTSTQFAIEVIDEIDFEKTKGVVQFGTEEILFNTLMEDGTTYVFLECERGYNSTIESSHLADSTGQILYYINDYTYSYDVQTIIPADSTAVEAWKVLNYEDVYNQSIRARNGIVISDSEGPHYPLKDYSVLLDELDSTYLDYEYSDQYRYIEYEYDSQRVFAGSSLNLYGADTTDVNESVVFTFYGTSSDGVEWTYTYVDSTEVGYILSETDNLQTAIDRNSNGIYQGIVNPWDSFIKPRTCKYLRIYFLSYLNVSTRIFKLVYDEIQQGQKVRNVSIPPTSKLTNSNISGTFGGGSSSGMISTTDWFTVSSHSSSMPSQTYGDEFYRIERGYQTGTVYARVIDDSTNIIDSIVLTQPGSSAILFNKNFLIPAFTIVYRYLQLKVNIGENINYATRDQTTRYGFQ